MTFSTSTSSPHVIDQLAPLLPPLPATLTLSLFPPSLLDEASSTLSLESLPDLSPNKSTSPPDSTSPFKATSHPPFDWDTLTSTSSSSSQDARTTELLVSTLTTLDHVQTLFSSVTTVYEHDLASLVHEYPCQYAFGKSVGSQASHGLKMVKSLEKVLEEVT
ncbi:hypothetical protein HMI56_001600 [Coelomomyces lativittatus]|nr:hypothetical protein HMI56_001600 [Coelomomyces lativittatus]